VSQRERGKLEGGLTEVEALDWVVVKKSVLGCAVVITSMGKSIN
jgi:hypothetical protein